MVANENIFQINKYAKQPRLNIIRGLNRREAAAYIGISATLFDDLASQGVFPNPIRARSRIGLGSFGSVCS
jgi:hypothetical protein